MNAPVNPKKLIPGALGDWEVVIGLEIHAQVNSRAKLFSGASTAFGGAPNDHVSLVDAAMPGMLPVINAECVAQAVRTGLGLKAKINHRSVFDRKNYFYPDLPQGYQISQYKDPIVGEGEVVVDVSASETITVGIERLHLEQDAGKSIHDLSPTDSYVDLNRSGVALMEIVSRPDMRSSDEAKAYVTKLRTILRYLGTCDGDMEKGNLRADVNVSVRRPGEPFGTRCEIKNVNSIRFIGQAIEYEARRQIAVIEDGGTIAQETRLFDAAKGETRSMRSKEEAHDYRYFPDPDLLPLEFDEAYVEALAAGLPELPDAKKARFISAYGLTPYDAGVLTAERDRADYLELMIAEGAEPKRAANWLINEYLARVNSQSSEKTRPVSSTIISAEASKYISEFTLNATMSVFGPVSASANAAIVCSLESGLISGPSAKLLLDKVMVIGPAADGQKVADIIRDENMKQVTDTGAIEKAVDDVIAANPDKAEQAKAKPTLAGWFVGQVMKATGGKAAPAAVNALVKQKLGIE